MKTQNFKTVLSFVCFCLSLLACEKPLLTEESGKSSQPEGNLTVSIFQLEHTLFESLTRVAASDVCTRLNFAVYDGEGVRVMQENQKVGDADFGSVSFQLSEGTYQLVAVAHSSSGNPTMTNPAKIQFTNAQGYTDTYLYNGMVTITDQPQSLSLSLNRIVSLCRFVITDAIPAEVSRIRFQYKGGSGAFDAATGFGTVKSTQTLWFDAQVGQQQTQYDLYTFLHAEEGTIHLQATAYDSNETPLYEHEMDIPMRQNEITWISGTFFSGSSNAAPLSSTVSLSTTWNGETHLSY